MKISKLLQETLNLNDYVMFFFCKCQNCYVLSALQPVVRGKVEKKNKTQKHNHHQKNTLCSEDSLRKMCLCAYNTARSGNPSMLYLKCFGSAGLIHLSVQNFAPRDLCWRSNCLKAGNLACLGQPCWGRIGLGCCFSFILCIETACMSAKNKLCRESICPAHSLLLVLEVRTGSETCSYCFATPYLLASPSCEGKMLVGDEGILELGSSWGQGFFSTKVVLGKLKKQMGPWAVLRTAAWERMTDSGGRLKLRPALHSQKGWKQTGNDWKKENSRWCVAKQTPWGGNWKEKTNRWKL